MTDNKIKLILLAQTKIFHMSEKELENFVGVLKIEQRKYDPVTAYDINEKVEITSHVPGIGHEFCGEVATVYNIWTMTNMIGVRTKYDTFSLKPEQVRKIK